MATVKELRQQARAKGIDPTGMKKAALEKLLRPPGIPTVLTDETQHDYVTAIMRGANLTDAAQYAGIHPATVGLWRQRLDTCNPQFDSDTGEIVTWTDDERNPPIPRLFEFFAAIRKAESDAKLLRLGQIERAASDPKYWTAAAWWLERKFPDEFGRRERRDIQISGRVEHDTTGVVDVDDVTVDGRNKLEALVAAANEIIAVNAPEAEIVE